MCNCSQAAITDAAFAHLSGIHTLNMSECNQAGITDAAFAHLRGIHTLIMGMCTQAGITDAAISHLRGIHTLSMCYCSDSITGSTFDQLHGISDLMVTNEDLFAVARDLGLNVEFG